METIDEQASNWVYKQEDGLNQQDKKLFLIWIENSKHKEAYNSIMDIRNSFKTLPNTCQNELKSEAKNALRKDKIIKTIKPLAIAAMLLLTLSFSIFQITSSSKPMYSEKFLSHYELNTIINLEDGSTITLDANSEIKVDFFKDTRNVSILKGKAIFEVAKDINRPFIIDSNNVQIEVVGTKFEVTNIKNTSSVQVREGIVKVAKQVSNNKYQIISQLTKGRNISINTKGKILSYGEINPNEIATWQKGYIVFNKTPLKNAMEEFSRYVDIKVDYQGFNIASLPVAGKFSIKEFDNFLRALPKIYPIKVDNKNNMITISNKSN